MNRVCLAALAVAQAGCAPAWTRLPAEVRWEGPRLVVQSPGDIEGTSYTLACDTARAKAEKIAFDTAARVLVARDEVVRAMNADELDLEVVGLYRPDRNSCYVRVKLRLDPEAMTARSRTESPP